MNRRFKMPMLAVLLVCLCTLGVKGGHAYAQERTEWRALFPEATASAFWRWWCPWSIPKGRRVRTGAIS